MSNNLVHLHVHSHFSPQDGVASCSQLAERAAELGMSALALTDHGRAGGLLQHQKACKEAGIKPIFGTEAYVAPGDHRIKEKIEDERTSYHLTVLAKTDKGLENIFRLSSLAWLEGFYYKPRISLDLLAQHAEGLIVLSGCSLSMLSWYAMEGRSDEAIQNVKYMRELFGDDYYIEVQNHGLDFQSTLKTALFSLSSILNIPIVATQDTHYIKPEDAELHKYICKLAAGDLEFETNQVWFKSYDELAHMFEPEERHALDRTNEVADKCNVEWKHDKTIWPGIKLEDTPENVLRRKTYEGLGRISKDDSDVYRERVERELGVITKMGFSTYFLVVADFTNYAKSQGIPCGPGRGSAASSLVCYCLGITEVDPIKYGLIFSRFLNEHRVSLPDIDSDFCRDRRDEVIQYVRDKYGHDKVAQIGTYSEFRPRGSLRDFARVCGYDIKVGEKLANLIPPPIAGKPLTFDEAIADEPKLLKSDTPEVVELARKAEGLKRQAGVHAAGIVVSDQNIMSICPLFLGRGNEVATQLDMHDVEDIGLVKFDFLGLKNLTVIDKTIKLVKENQDIDIIIQDIDVEDQEVYKNIFQRGDLDGVFQFETSAGFRDLCIEVKPDSIYDLACINSVFRPGPLEAGLKQRFVDGRQGRATKCLFPELEPILEKTHNCMIFQEQLMQICTDIAGYTPSEADNMRRIVGKKKRKDMKAEREKFVGSLIKNNISESNAIKLFDDIEGYALYSFNLSHAIAYSITSFRTAWLKHYYPVEFYTALLNCSFKNQDDLIKYIYSAREHEVPIEPPDINRSGAEFTIDNNTILFGFAGVKGLGAKACQEFIKARPTEGFSSLVDIINAGVNLKTIRMLAECGALNDLSDIQYKTLINNVDTIVNHYRKVANYQDRLMRIAAREKEIEEAVNAGKQAPRRLPQPKQEPEMPQLITSDEVPVDGLALEKKTLGFYLTGHPLDKFPAIVNAAQTTIQSIQSGELTDGERIRIPVVIDNIEPRRTKKGKNYGILIVEDKTGRIEATVFPKQWARLKDRLQEDTIITMVGAVRYTVPNEDVPPLARIVVMDARMINTNQAVRMHDIALSLRDGSKVIFKLNDDTNYTLWQQALGLVNNLEKHYE